MYPILYSQNYALFTRNLNFAQNLNLTNFWGADNSAAGGMEDTSPNGYRLLGDLESACLLWRRGEVYIQ